MTFIARYGGTCDVCGFPIVPGDQITFVAGMSDRHPIHAYCADTAPERPAAVVCTNCFTEKPCACDDGQGPS